jgi:hypothetical protein
MITMMHRRQTKGSLSLYLMITICTVLIHCSAQQITFVLLTDGKSVDYAIAGAQGSARINAENEFNRAVWVYWDDDESSILIRSTIDNFYQKGIRTLYISGVSEDMEKGSEYQRLQEFIEYAKSKGMGVYGIPFEDPGYVKYSESQLRSEFSAIVTKYKQIFNSGFVIDVEPHMLDDWSSSTEASYLKKYVRMSNILRSEADKHGVVFADTVPWWYHKKLQEVAGFPNGIDALGGHFVDLMTYTWTADSMRDRVQIVADETTKPKSISINIREREGGDPYLSGAEITKAITYLEELANINSDIIRVTFFEASSVLGLPPSLFP